VVRITGGRLEVEIVNPEPTPDATPEAEARQDPELVLRLLHERTVEGPLAFGRSPKPRTAQLRAGTAGVIVPAGAWARPISDLLAGPDGRKIGLARQARRAGNTSRQSCERIDRYWRDIHCNYPHDEGACNELLKVLRLLPTSC